MPKLTDSQNGAVVALVSKCYDEAYQSKREQTRIENPFPGRFGFLDDPWRYFQDAYDRKLWQHMGTNPSWKSRPGESAPSNTVEGYTTFLTDNKPRAEFVPVEQSDYERAVIVKTVYDKWWTEQNNDLTLALGVKDSRKFGIGWEYLKVDPKTKKQVLAVVHPDSLLVDPDCTIDSYLSGEGPSYVIYEYMANLGDIKAAYPDVDYEDFNLKWQPTPVNWIDRAKKWFARANEQVGSNQTVPVYELWLRDDGVTFREEDLGDAVAVIEKKKYPKGRRIVVAGGMVLDDGPNPYDHGEFPFTPIPAYPETGKFYGPGDIEKILSDVIMLMRTKQLLFDGTVKSTGGFYLVSPQAGLTKERISNAPVQVLEVQDVNRALRVERGLAPPRHLFDMEADFKKAIDDTTGQHDISRGAYVPGNKTAQEVAALTESDKTRVRLAAKYLGFAVSRIGRQWFSNAVQWSDWETFVRIANSDENSEAYGKMESVPVSGKDFKAMGEFDISVVDSSSLPNYYQERRQMAMQLFQMQVIDAESLLEALDWPDRKALVARMTKQAPPPQEMAPEGMPPEMPPPGMEQPPMPPAAMPQEMPQPDLLSQLPPEMGAMLEEMARQQGVDPEQLLMQMMQQGAMAGAVQ